MKTKLFLAGLLLGLALVTTSVNAQSPTITFTAGSPSLRIVYDWTITKSVGGTQASNNGVTYQVSRGKSIDLPYTITVTRQASGAAVGSLSFTVNCPLVNNGISATSVVVTSDDSSTVIASSQLTSASVQFNNIPWSRVPSTASETPQGALIAVCSYTFVTNGISSTTTVKSDPAPVVFSTGNTVEVRGTATLTDAVTWPNWSTWYNGGWLTTPPTTTVTQGTAPAAGVTVRGSVTYQYTWSVSNVVLCFQGAQVVNTATLTAGTGTEQRSYKADASATLQVIDCDARPSFTIDQPNLQTTLTYAWTQTIAPVSAAAITVPWGGGGTVQAQATFTRSVTSATFQASFNLQIANPVAAPIAISNLQLSCPWGGNMMLPCGGAVNTGGVFGSAWNTGGANSLIVIPASGSISCMVNNMQMTASWGSDFTQPCTILSSSWLGTQVTYQGLVLNFQAPQRWITINNCALWTVTCSVPTGNAFFVPTIGGLPTAQQVCGSDTSNTPLPPQPFSVSFGGGWIGDGTQPAACSSGVTTTCTSQLQLQSTAGTTQGFGGTQTGTITLQATPIECPKPPPLPLQTTTTTPILLPSPMPYLTTKTVDPLVTAVVTRTTIRGSFTWSINSRLAPSNLALTAGNQGVLGRYTVTATPKAVAGAADPAQYQLAGVVTIANPDLTSTVRVDEAFVVVDSAAVPLGCQPGLPGMLSPGARVDCAFMVNYNQEGNPNNLLGRATVVSDWGVRRTVESAATRFTFDNSDVSQARGACARVSQTFATNWFDLQQVTGVAPSFDPSAPTSVCGPTTWAFDVRFTTREAAPCGSQQVLQTVSAVFLADTQGGTAQSTSMGNLFITGSGCPPAPAEFVTGDASTLAPPDFNTGTGSTTSPSGGSSSSGSGGGGGTSSSGSTGTGGSSSSSSGGGGSSPPPAGASSPADAPEGPLPVGLSVSLGAVQAARSASPNWDLAMEPVADNVTFTRGTAATVSFTLSWERTKPATDYSGSLTINNNAAQPAVLDGVVVNLLDTLGSGDATDEVQADCPVSGSSSSSSDALQPVTASNTMTIPPNGRVVCNFTLKSTSSGALVATVTPAEGGDGVVSKMRQATSLLADGNCGKLVTGLAASELGPGGVLKAGGNGTTEEDICTSASKVINVAIPANAPTDRGCVFPVVALAYIKPQDGASTGSGALATASTDVLVSGCSSQLGARSTTAASIASISVSKGRALRWAVNISTSPPVNGTFAGESLQISTTWEQRSELALKLNVSGAVEVTGTAAATQAKVIAIPMCSPDNSTDCLPVTLQANCKASPDSKDTSSCVFNFTRLPNQPGLLLPVVDQTSPAVAQPYEPARARFGGRPAALCAVLSEQRSILGEAGTAEAKAVATGAATPLSTEAFCGPLQSRNYTLAFDGIECGSMYNFTARASAAPVLAGAPAVSAVLAFNVTC